jgi:hypothetical protein
MFPQTHLVTQVQGRIVFHSAWAKYHKKHDTYALKNMKKIEVYNLKNSQEQLSIAGQRRKRKNPQHLKSND